MKDLYGDDGLPLTLPKGALGQKDPPKRWERTPPNKPPPVRRQPVIREPEPDLEE